MSRTISHFVGIDHGATGALVALNTRGELHGFVSFTGGDWLKIRGQIVDLFESMPAPFITEENVQGRKEDAKHAPQVLQFGRVTGIVTGILIGALGVEIDESVTPNVWMAKMGCLTGGDKAVTMRAAAHHIPTLPRDLPKNRLSGVSDAALVALYSLRLHAARKAKP